MTERDDCPQAWIDLVRRAWPVLHTMQLSVKGAGGGWMSCWTVAVPDASDDDGEGRVTRADPSVATKYAFDAWNKAHEKLAAMAEKNESLTHAEFRFAVLKLDREGALREHDYTVRGGKLLVSGGVEDASTDEDEDKGKASLYAWQRDALKEARTERAALVKEVIGVSKAVADMACKTADLIGKVGDLATGIVASNADVETARIEATVAEHKFRAASEIGTAIVQGVANNARTKAAKDLLTDVQGGTTDKAKLCRWLAGKIDGPTCIRLESAGVDWKGIVAVFATAGDNDGWEPQVLALLHEFAKRPEVWSMCGPELFSAFERVFDVFGLPMDLSGATPSQPEPPDATP